MRFARNRRNHHGWPDPPDIARMGTQGKQALEDPTLDSTLRVLHMALNIMWA